MHVRVSSFELQKMIRYVTDVSIRPLLFQESVAFQKKKTIISLPWVNVALDQGLMPLLSRQVTLWKLC